MYAYILLVPYFCGIIIDLKYANLNIVECVLQYSWLQPIHSPPYSWYK